MSDNVTERYDVFLSFHGSHMLKMPSKDASSRASGSVGSHYSQTGTASCKSLETMRDLVREQLAPDNGVLQQTWLNEGHIGKISIFFDDHVLTKSSEGRLSNIFDGLLKTRGGGVVAILAVPGYFEREWCLTEMISAFELAEQGLVSICFIGVGMTVHEIKNTPVMKEANLIKYIEMDQAQIHSIEVQRIDAIADSDLNALADKISSLIVDRAGSVVPGNCRNVCFEDVVANVWNLVKRSQYKDEFLLRFNSGKEHGILASLAQATVCEMKKFLMSRIDDAFSRSKSKLEAFEKKWCLPWCLESRWSRDKQNLMQKRELVLGLSTHKKRKLNEKIIDVFFAVQIPPTSLSGVRKRADEVVEVKKFGDIISTDNRVSSEFRKQVKSVYVEESVDCMQRDLQKSSIRLLCWIAEGCNELQNGSSVEAFVKSNEERPEVAIVCMRYGAELHAAKLLDLGVKSVVSVAMDAFAHGYDRFSEVACCLLLPLCTSIFKGTSVKEAFTSFQPEANRMSPPVQVRLLQKKDTNHCLCLGYEVSMVADPNVVSTMESPRFTDWKHLPDFNVDMADLDLLRECRSELLEQRSRKHRYRYFMLTPRQVETAARGEWNRARAVAMQIMCTVAESDEAVVHTYRVACADDAERVQRDINGGIFRRCLLWLDFVGVDQIPFGSLQEWIEGIESDTKVIFLITSASDMFDRVQALLSDTDIVGDEAGTVGPTCLDLVEARVCGVLIILPWTDDNGQKHSVLDRVSNFALLSDQIAGVVYKSEGAWRERNIFVYRDDDNSTKIRFNVGNVDELKRVLDVVYVGEDRADSFQLLADAFVLNTDQIKFDYSAFASQYERIVLQLETPTLEQQKVISLCKRRNRVRIEAVAGTGKTFVALNMVQDFLLCQLRSSHPCKAIYVCRTRSLAYHFVKWLCLRVCDGHSMRKLLKFIFILTAEDRHPMRLSKKDGKLSCEGSFVASPGTSSFGIIVVDEAHDVFGRDKAESGFHSMKRTLSQIFEDNPEAKHILLSDICQASMERSDITYPNNSDEPATLSKVGRSSQRIVAASIHYQFPKMKGMEFTHDSDGLKLNSRIFLSPDSKVDFDLYAAKTVEAIEHICSTFDNMQLHDRIAIIVPDEEFRIGLCEGPRRLKDLLRERKEDLAQYLVPVRAVDASAFLSLSIEKKICEASWIVVDSLSEMCGLERLIVFGVGLDEAIGDAPKLTQLARSRIYRAITRTHLMFYLINHRVEGGWFEWLDHLDKEKTKFSFETAEKLAADVLTGLLSAHKHNCANLTSEAKRSSVSMVAHQEVGRSKERGDERSCDNGSLDVLVDTGNWDTSCNEAPPNLKPLLLTTFVPIRETRKRTLKDDIGIFRDEEQVPILSDRKPKPETSIEILLDPNSGPEAERPPVEFDHAKNYIMTIKNRFATEPNTYYKFLEILHMYQKEQATLKTVLEEVAVLFSEHPDLLKEFTTFLPDSLQAEAKARLDRVAKESQR